MIPFVFRMLARATPSAFVSARSLQPVGSDFQFVSMLLELEVCFCGLAERKLLTTLLLIEETDAAIGAALAALAQVKLAGVFGAVDADLR